MANIFEELTDQTRSLVENSLSLAIGNKNPEALSLHMLWALVADSNSILNQIFNKTNVSKDAVLLDIKVALLNSLLAQTLVEKISKFQANS